MAEGPFLPNLGRVLRSKKGSKISRYFRHVFEHDKAKKAIGFALILLITQALFVSQTRASHELADIKTVKAPIILKTLSGIQYPVINPKVTQGYKFYHPGIDIDGATGDDIRPIMKGVVEEVGYSRFGYGNAIILNHGNGIKSLYAHLSKIDVKMGQEVTNESVIGKMGASGRAFGDHLHLEVIDSGKRVNPFEILPKVP